MENETLSNHLATIRAAILAATGTTRSGSQLRGLIDGLCPDLDLRAAVDVPVGPGALKKFLATYFSDIVQPVGKAGGDIAYYLGPQPVPRADPVALEPGVPVSEAAPRLWAAFASPHLGQIITFSRSANLLQVRARLESLPQDEITVPPVSQEEFRSISEEFLATTPSDVQDSLRRTLDVNPFYYPSWVSTMKKIDLSLYQKWGLFRVQKLIDLFKRRLIAANVPEAFIENAVRSLIADQANTYNERVRAFRASETSERAFVQPTPANLPTIGTITTQGGSDIDNARAAALSAISYMSTREIRQIMVPLGAVIDAGLLPKK